MDASTGPSVTAHCAAISDDVGTKTLHTVPGMSWLSSLDAQDLSRLDVTATEDIDVPCVTLDQFCTDEGNDAIDLLKIDVEGHELSVLRGASGLLSAGQIGFVQFEMSPAWIETHTFLRDILDALGPRYRTSRILHMGLDPVEWTYKDEVFEPANYLAERIGPPS
jgi:FkbM family methyltransferase